MEEVSSFDRLRAFSNGRWHMANGKWQIWAQTAGGDAATPEQMVGVGIGVTWGSSFLATPG